MVYYKILNILCYTVEHCGLSILYIVVCICWSLIYPSPFGNAVVLLNTVYLWGLGITDLIDISLSRLWELVMDRDELRAAVPRGHTESDTTEWLNWLNVRTEMFASRIASNLAHADQ